jgi:hypothetical protein
MSMRWFNSLRQFNCVSGLGSTHRTRDGMIHNARLSCQVVVGRHIAHLCQPHSNLHPCSSLEHLHC